MFKSVPARAGNGRRAMTLALLSASCLVLGTAGPASAATEVAKDTHHVLMVQGHSTAFDVDGCSVLETFVDATEESTFYLQICVDTDTGVYGSGATTTFEVADDGDSVRVVAALDLFTTGEDGEPAGALYLDNTWTASGRAIMVNDRYVEHLPGGYRATTRVKGTRTPATVTGTLPIQEGFITELTTTYEIRGRA